MYAEGEFAIARDEAVLRELSDQLCTVEANDKVPND